MNCGMDVRTFCGFSQGTTDMHDRHARPRCARLPRWQIQARGTNLGFRRFHVPLKRYNRTFEELFLSVLKESPMRIRLALVFVATLLLTAAGVSVAQEPKSEGTSATSEAVLKAADIGAKLFPDRVYFRGQVGTAQMRNAGGVRYADGFFVLAALVDSSGYASGIKEKYQAHLITDVAIE